VNIDVPQEIIVKSQVRVATAFVNTVVGSQFATTFPSFVEFELRSTALEQAQGTSRQFGEKMGPDRQPGLGRFSPMVDMVNRPESRKSPRPIIPH
jgi:hypothetical protein